MNDHRTLSTFSSGRDDVVPFVGFRLNLHGDLKGTISYRMSLEELALFMRQLKEHRDYIVEFGAARTKKKAA